MLVELNKKTKKQQKKTKKERALFYMLSNGGKRTCNHHHRRNVQNMCFSTLNIYKRAHTTSALVCNCVDNTFTRMY